ncbi:MAG: hypothetical protein K6G08_06710 [Prevotella sp.]|nr:hypothetical protein [Prevotella sp.]
MKTEDKDKEPDMAEVVLTVNVGVDVIDKVRSGQITHIALDINDNNYRQILENNNGHLLLIVDEMPTTFHGCYLYNNGVFPYAVKDTLDFLLLIGNDDNCLAKIIGIDTKPGIRFRFQGQGKPSVEDPKGDSCIWEIQFEVVPVPKEPKRYLMRWNPSVSSFTEMDYAKCIADMELLTEDILAKLEELRG